MKLTYRQEGDYLVPNIKAEETPNISKYGWMRLRYLKEYNQVLYSAMIMDMTLTPHLEQIDKQANEMMEKLTKEMAKQYGVTEELKARDMMEWVGQMNNIIHSAEEIVLKELIYS